MFSVEEYNGAIECKTLEHSVNVFHEALSDGDRYYHVHNKKGQDYDILYKGNSEWFGDSIPSYIGKISPEYTHYDENEKESIDIDFLNAFDQYICLKLTEYSIAMARVVLKYTNGHVYFMDNRINWFIEPDERLHIGNMPEVTKATLFLTGPLGKGFTKGEPINETTNKKSDIFMFNSAFYMQDMLDGKKRSQIKYMEYPVAKALMGIGGILVCTSCFKEFARQLGVELVHNEDTIAKFKVSNLEKYFHLNFRKEDNSDENTMKIHNVASLYITWRYYNIPGVLKKDMLVEKFLNELNEYTEAVIGDKKTLGVLIRGTDYKSTGLGGSRTQATVEDMTPAIKMWMEKYGYEKIVLATEDLDILNQMREIFGKKVVAIAQERHTVAEFHKGQIINELEKEIYSADEYDSRVIETNINYFYALYMLSECSGFMCSGQNNGWDTVNAMNDGKFEHVYRFFPGQNPITDDWRTIRPVNAGIFARAVYPEDKAFYMTFHLTLDEQVDVQALTSAWNKTMDVYPYFKNAILKRDGQYVLTENPLDFVIKETTARIEPSTISGNFKLVTICYSGNNLVFYIDHVPTDMTAMRTVFETFLYYYYCETDRKDYPVPEGVHTLSEVPLVGSEIDAYTMVAPINPQSMLDKRGGTASFIPPEFNVPAPATFDSYGRFMITVKSDEFMEYARSVGASPMSLLNQVIVQSIQKVHPENTLPIQLRMPVSIRKVFHNENSLLHQVVHCTYSYDEKDASAEEINSKFREFLKGFSSDQSIKTVTGVYAGIIEGFKRAISANAMDIAVQKMASSTGVSLMSSYFGKLKTGEYGDRVHLHVFHAMPGTGLMAQMTEIGNTFYISWCQGILDDVFVKAAVERMRELNMPSAEYSRVE